MPELAHRLFDPDLLAHATCEAWRSQLFWLNAVADGMIALAHYTVAFTILYFARKRHDLDFRWMVLVFAAFVFACGMTHTLEVWTIWKPACLMEGVVNLGAGLLSVTTAVLLIALVPRALVLPSPAQLELANCALARQIEERKRTEAQLAQALAETSDVMETIPDLVCVLDGDGRLVRWNRRVELVTGFTHDEIAGKPAVQFFPPAEQPLVHAAIRHVLDAGYAEVEGNLVAKNGTLVSYQFIGAAMKNYRGEATGLTAVGRDVSERKQAEHLRNALREKEILLKELHHRVKNNLQVISSLLSLQASHVEDPKALAMFEESRNRVRLIAKVHESLYRGENISGVEVAAFVREVTNDLFRSYAINPEAVRLTVDVASDPLGVDLAVPCGLIINELVSNALKHAFPDGRKGEIRVELHRHASGAYHLQVKDDGIGLPNETSYQEAPTLGWQLVGALTRQLGGSIEVKGGAGTEVIVTFPAPS
jgi:PAS domain S-box-containing protein